MAGIVGSGLLLPRDTGRTRRRSAPHVPRHAGDRGGSRTCGRVAGAEPWLQDDATPRFLAYDFPTGTDIFSNPDPPGRYPWPVTLTGTDDDDSDPAAPLARTTRFEGETGASGVRVFDFEATAAGAGAIFRVETGTSLVVVARIPRPPGF